jgi:hypothetical protein
VHDQAAGHPVQGQGQGDRVAEPEAVGARPARRRGPGRVQHEAVDPARLRRLGSGNADGVDHDGERRPGPGLDQPGGLAVGDRESYAGRDEIAQLANHCGTGAVVVAELVADADHHDRPRARTWHGYHRPFGINNDLSTVRSRKWVEQEMQGS